MLRKLLGIFPGVAAFLLLMLVGGGELWAQNEGDQELADPDQPVTRVANRGGTFLALGVGARANALSGAATAISDGVDALYWNPANVALEEAWAIAFSYAEIFENSDIEHFYAGVLVPFAGGTLGASLISLSSGDIPRTVETTPSTQNVGVGSTFDWGSSAMGITYARMITDRLGVGGTLKWVNEGIDNAEANWVAGDIGVTFETGLYGTTIAAAATNISGKARMEGSLIQQNRTAAAEVFETGRTIGVNLDTEELALPTSFSFGLQVDLAGTPEALLTPDPRHNLAALADFRDATDTDIQTMLALEYSYNEILFVRGGKKWFNENLSEREFSDGLSAGFGVKLPVLGRHFSFDYGYTWLVEGLDRIQVFSFEYGF